MQMNNPTITDTKNLLIHYKLRMVIILSIDEHDNIMYSSYGKTKQLCTLAEILADAAFEHIKNFF